MLRSPPICPRDFTVDDLRAIRRPSLPKGGEGEGGEPAARQKRFGDGVSGPVTTFAA